MGSWREGCFARRLIYYMGGEIATGFRGDCVYIIV